MEENGLRSLRDSLGEATELLSVLVSLGRSKELPSAELLNLADQAAEDLAAWRAALKKLAAEPIPHPGGTQA